MSSLAFCQEGVYYTLKKKQLLRQWLQLICQKEDKKIKKILFIFCSDKQIVEINARFLQHPFATDIITFDYSQNNELEGEIYISFETVFHNAQRFVVSFEDELYRVMAHGMLHLCGYRDKTANEKMRMRQKEDAALKALKKMLS